MKFIHLILSIWLFTSGKLICQNANHPTISDVIIGFKPVASGTVIINNKREIKMMPEAIVKLKPGDVKKIRFTVVKDNNIVSSIKCPIDSILEITHNGIKTFYRDDNGYHITSSDTLLLNTYTFNIVTEDSNGNLSPTYTKTK